MEKAIVPFLETFSVEPSKCQSRCLHTHSSSHPDLEESKIIMLFSLVPLPVNDKCG